MLNNILLNVNYGYDMHQCVSTTHCLMNQISPTEIISIFPNSQQKDYYESYFSQYNNDLIKFIYNPNNNILLNNLYYQYLPTHDWFAFLSPYILYNKNFTEELQSLCSSQTKNSILHIFPHNSSKIFKIIVYSKNILMEYIKKNYSIQNLLDEKYDDDSKKNLISFSCSSWKDIEEQYLLKQTTYHNDEYSIFTKFIETKNSNLKDSFVYINKIKHRIYNITNNIIGIIEEYIDNKIKVLWSTKDGDQIQAQYEFNYNTKSYNRI